MRSLSIVFMGTPDFAVPALRTLVEHGYCIAGVVTAPDRPAGRGRNMQPPAVKKYALSRDIKVLQPVSLKEGAFIDELRALNSNLFIVVAFRMLPEVVWKMPEYGTFNLHASLLPQYRGAAPINWAIINGERTTGLTTFFIDENIDTGRIILQESVPVGTTETAGELHDKLMHTGAGLVLKTVELIENNKVVAVQQQESSRLIPAPKIHKDTCRINWNKEAEAVYNFIRGLSPYPAAWTLLKNNGEEIPVKIYRAEKEKTGHSYKPGRVIPGKKQLKIAVMDGFIHIKEMQLPGKRKMNTADVLNGFDIHPEAEMV